MERTNPYVIPRNHNVESALQAAQEQNLEPFSKLLESMRDPYKENPQSGYFRSPPEPHERVVQTFCGT